MKPIIITIIAVFLLLSFCHYIADTGLRRYHQHSYHRWQVVFSDTTYYDCLFIGSSRTHDHLNPRIFDSILHTNSYNAGIDGANLLEFTTIWEAYLEKHRPPKYLLLNMESTCFANHKRFLNPLQYYPFLQNNSLRRALAQHNNPLIAFFPYAPFLALTTYNDRTRTEIVKGWAGQNDLENSWEYKGYRGIDNDTMSDNFPPEIPINLNNIGESAQYLRQIAVQCRQNNTQLILVYHPTFEDYFRQHIAQNDQVLDTIYSIVRQYQLPYLRHDSLQQFQKRRYFSDRIHLNQTGAKLYSQYLAHSLQAIIQSEHAVP